MEMIDAAEGKHSYTYAYNNQMLSSEDPLGRMTAYGYDANGNVTQITDPAGDLTTHTYDAQNNLLHHNLIPSRPLQP